MQFDRQSIRDEVVARLGGEYIEVEIGVDGLERAIDNALRLFDRYKPATRREGTKTIQTGYDAIVLPEDVNGVKHCNIIIPFMAGVNQGLALESALLTGIPIMMGIGDINIDISWLRYRRMFLKSVAREVGTDPDYEAVKDPTTGIWTVYTFATAGPGCYIDIESFIDHSPDLNTIPKDYRHLFADLALAESKLIIGQVRSKIGAIPVANTSVRLNGAELIAEGTNEKNRITSDLIESNRQMLYPRWASFVLPFVGLSSLLSLFMG
jgi:hypothetical protein